jgi:hypothetical protein
VFIAVLEHSGPFGPLLHAGWAGPAVPHPGGAPGAVPHLVPAEAAPVVEKHASWFHHHQGDHPLRRTTAAMEEYHWDSPRCDHGQRVELVQVSQKYVSYRECFVRQDFLTWTDDLASYDLRPLNETNGTG